MNKRPSVLATPTGAPMAKLSGDMEAKKHSSRQQRMLLHMWELTRRPQVGYGLTEVGVYTCRCIIVFIYCDVGYILIGERDFFERISFAYLSMLVRITHLRERAHIRKLLMNKGYIMIVRIVALVVCTIAVGVVALLAQSHPYLWPIILLLIILPAFLGRMIDWIVDQVRKTRE